MKLLVAGSRHIAERIADSLDLKHRAQPARDARGLMISPRVSEQPEWMIASYGDAMLGHRFEKIVVFADTIRLAPDSERQRFFDWLDELKTHLATAEGTLTII